MLVQRLLHPVEDPTSLLDVARAEIFLNHRRRRALVRADDIRARGAGALVAISFRAPPAVVVGIAGVEDVDGVRGVQDVRLDAILALREAVTSRVAGQRTRKKDEAWRETRRTRRTRLVDDTDDVSVSS